MVRLPRAAGATLGAARANTAKPNRLASNHPRLSSETNTFLILESDQRAYDPTWTAPHTQSTAVPRRACPRRERRGLARSPSRVRPGHRQTKGLVEQLVEPAREARTPADRTD